MSTTSTARGSGSHDKLAAWVGLPVAAALTVPSALLFKSKLKQLVSDKSPRKAAALVCSIPAAVSVAMLVFPYTRRAGVVGIGSTAAAFVFASATYDSFLGRAAMSLSGRR